MNRIEMISSHRARARALRWIRGIVALPILLGFPVSQATAQLAAAGTDPTRAGRFDMGKMWTFENAPMEYFTETYGFQADEDWFERARLAALRVPGCSAAFVSPNGLVVTNHHCARGAVGQVTREGESLLDTGFYATSLEEERPIPDYYVDQLIAAEDVSDEVLQALDRATSDEARAEFRQNAVTRIQERISARHAGGEGDVRVEVTALYNGGRYSAYTYRRFTDVRMVAAAELQLGFFGGDPDNFTYPRYALDFAFLRVYGSDGEPLETDHYFNWSLEGVEEGDAVFIIGNPGPTNRLNTVAQLEFQRDVSVAAQISFLSSRLAIMREFYDDHPEQGEAMGLRDQMFSLSNSLKANSGRLDALKDPVIMARKADGERLFQEALAADPELRGPGTSLLEEVAEIQREKMGLGAEYAAFTRLAPGNTEASVLSRALYGIGYLDATTAGGASSQLEQIRRLILDVEDLPFEMEEALLTARLQDLQSFLGPEHPVTDGALEGRSVEGAATVLMNLSALATREKAESALRNGSLSADDPAIRLAASIFPSYLEFQSRLTALTEREQELAADLGRARFAVYGPDVPPDASRSPRITDGVVKPYEYNGTLAPVYTTFFGLFDHFYSYGPKSDWNLPDRWLPPPRDLNLGTPLNFISTADTYGGNSGSPAVTPDLNIVGLNFDRNVEGLSRDFIYLPERGRNIMVDVRAIKEAMDKVYDADRIVQEILTHRLFRTEAEADAAGEKMKKWVLILLLAVPAPGSGQAILNVERLKSEGSDGFSGRASSTLSMKAGNTDIFQIGGSLGLGVLTGTHWVRVFAGLDRLKKGSDQILDNQYLHLRYNYLVGDGLRSFHFLQLQNNQNLFLKRRFLLGSGLRYRLTGGAEAGLDVGTGVMLETERLDPEKVQPGEDQETETLRMATLLVGSGPIADGSRWTAVVYYQPAFSGFEDYRLLGEAGLSVKIINSLDLTVDLTWRHDSRAPVGLKEDDFGFKTGISLTVG